MQFSVYACVILFCLLQGKLTASAVGSIVGMQSAEIQQIASEYAEKVSEDIDFTFSRKIWYLYRALSSNFRKRPLAKIGEK